MSSGQVVGGQVVSSNSVQWSVSSIRYSVFSGWWSMVVGGWWSMVDCWWWVVCGQCSVVGGVGLWLHDQWSVVGGCGLWLCDQWSVVGGLWLCDQWLVVGGK